MLSSTFFSFTHVCPSLFFSCCHSFGPINYAWSNTVQVSHTLAAVFLSVTVFFISHENDLRSSSYPPAVFSRLKQSLLLPPCGSFLSIECLYDSLLCTQKLPVLEDTDKLKARLFKVMQLQGKRAAWNLKESSSLLILFLLSFPLFLSPLFCSSEVL